MRLIDNERILPILRSHLLPSAAEDDLVLEVQCTVYFSSCLEMNKPRAENDKKC